MNFYLFIVCFIYCIAVFKTFFYLILCAHYAQPTSADSGPFIIIIISPKVLVFLKEFKYFLLLLLFTYNILNCIKSCTYTQTTTSQTIYSYKFRLYLIYNILLLTQLFYQFNCKYYQCNSKINKTFFYRIKLITAHKP